MPRVASTSNIRNPKRYGYDVQIDDVYLRTAIGPERQMTIQSIEIIDLQGKVLVTKELTGSQANSTVLDISNFPDGIYQAYIRSDKWVKALKFVVSN